MEEYRLLMEDALRKLAERREKLTRARDRFFELERKLRTKKPSWCTDTTACWGVQNGSVDEEGLTYCSGCQYNENMGL